MEIQLNEYEEEGCLMMRTVDFEPSLIEESVDLFIDVFSRAPWYDVFESREEVVDFFKAFIQMSTFKGFQLLDNNNKIAGLSIGFVKPWLKAGEMRYEYFIDQLCVDSALQGKGLGRQFMKEIENRLRLEGISDIILNTELSSPAYQFYLRIGFQGMKEVGFLSKEL